MATAKRVVRKKPEKKPAKKPAKRPHAPAKPKTPAKAPARNGYSIEGPTRSARCINRSIRVKGVGVGRNRKRTLAKRIAKRAWDAQMRAGLATANRIRCPGRCREGNCRKIGTLRQTGFGGGPGRAWTITPIKPRGWQAVFRKWRRYRLTCRCG